MDKYKTIFPNKALLPVIHVEDLDQALRNTEVARKHGSDGVFLIGHGMSDESLRDIFHLVHQEHNDWWIGVNFLRTDLTELARFIPAKANGIWTDNAGVESGAGGLTDATLYRIDTEDHPGLYFGGVAFKYQRSNKTPAEAAQLAMGFMDVITTSGTGTGSAPAVEKIRSMREAIGDYPLAIASGITPENIENYLNLTDCFLVATGISKSHTELDPTKVRKLAYRIHQTA